MKHITGTYRIIITNHDWGCAVSKAIIKLDEPLKNINKDCLWVEELKMVTDVRSTEYPMIKHLTNRKVTDLYPCDSEGNRTSDEESPSRPEAEATEAKTSKDDTTADSLTSQFWCVELRVGPTEGSPLVATGPMQIFRWSDPYELRFKYEEAGIALDIDPVATGRSTPADVFEKREFTATDGTEYKLALYNPGQKADTLFVWLHGLGEGQYEGSDAYLPLVGHKGTVLAGTEFQNAIDGAVVLVPQCPTYWMDADGKCGNFSAPHINADGTSHYTKSLEELIDAYADEMNAKHVVLAGCSNGGFMCLVLAMSRPERYDAIVPICEAVPDRCISDEAIKRLAMVPQYYVYSKDDPIVPPELHEVPTIERLRAAGAEELHVSVTDHVLDNTGLYKNKDGSPYIYMGHLSWIYFDNDETDDGTGLSAWDWINGTLNGKQ